MCNVLIIAGRGVRIANGVEELIALSHKTNIPIATTFLGKDLLENSVGTIGIKGNPEAKELLEKAEIVLAIGCSLPIAQMGYDYERFNARNVIVVNIEPPHEKVKYYKYIQMDAKEFLRRCNEVSMFLPRIIAYSE